MPAGRAAARRATRHLLALAAGLFAVGLAATQARATLGKPSASIEADRRSFRGQARRSLETGYSMHEITAADGTRVREYVSPDDIVFGVTWEGQAVPDLTQLLGPYFEEFRAAVRSPARRRQPLGVRTQHLIVETGGPARALRGRVYVPALVPASVPPAAIR